ncbi:hypothetical protein [Streptomyces sp. MP131-18]|uniref:hypothetical protein n=1 Tax=Streptomyces sp. MP131-18 TaxID=1857892 RepID=UPI00097C8423|nr:hypothetical protein [Streptomyces sp. MP131-18]
MAEPHRKAREDGRAGAVEELLAAAGLLRRRATEATNGPWWRPLDTRHKDIVLAPLPDGERGTWTDGVDPATGLRESCVVVKVPTWSTGRHSRSRSGRDLEYIALMDPEVGQGVAALLELAASEAQGDFDNDPKMTEKDLAERYAGPLTVAHLLLGDNRRTMP